MLHRLELPLRILPVFCDLWPRSAVRASGDLKIFFNFFCVSFNLEGQSLLSDLSPHRGRCGLAAVLERSPDLKSVERRSRATLSSARLGQTAKELGPVLRIVTVDRGHVLIAQVSSSLSEAPHAYSVRGFDFRGQALPPHESSKAGTQIDRPAFPTYPGCAPFPPSRACLAAALT